MVCAKRRATCARPHTSEPRQSRPPAKPLPIRVSTIWPRLRCCSPCEYAPAIRRGSRLASGAISFETRLMRGPVSACLGEIVEIPLGVRVPAQAQHVRWTDLRIELDVVARPAPEVTRVGEQIVRLEDLPGIDAQLGQIQVDPARLHMMRIEID